MHDHRREFDTYRRLLDHALDWDLLYDLADRIYYDRRLSWREKDRLYTILDAREQAMGGATVRCLQTSSAKHVLGNA